MAPVTEQDAGDGLHRFEHPVDVFAGELGEDTAAQRLARPGGAYRGVGPDADDPGPAELGRGHPPSLGAAAAR